MDIAGELSPFRINLKLFESCILGRIFYKCCEFQQSEFYYPTLDVNNVDKIDDIDKVEDIDNDVGEIENIENIDSTLTRLITLTK